jgi:hypothetical protein
MQRFGTKSSVFIYATIGCARGCHDAREVQGKRGARQDNKQAQVQEGAQALDSLCCVHGAQRAAFVSVEGRDMCELRKWFIFYFSQPRLPRQFFLKNRDFYWPNKCLKLVDTFL